MNNNTAKTSSEEKMNFNILDLTFMLEPEFGTVPIAPIENPTAPVSSPNCVGIGEVEPNTSLVSSLADSYSDFNIISMASSSSNHQSNIKSHPSATPESTKNGSRNNHVPPCLDKTKTLLPADFEPSNYSIICGNKRKYFKSVGNQRLRLLVQSFIPEYSKAEGKLEKSVIVNKVMMIVREACPVGSFVAYEKGRWWQVSERTSREKVGSYFRDFLAGKYKSSSQNKIARRKSARKEQKEGDAAQTSSSIPSSQGNNAGGHQHQGSNVEMAASAGTSSLCDIGDWNPLPLL